MNLFYVDKMVVWRDEDAPGENFEGMYLKSMCPLCGGFARSVEMHSGPGHLANT